MHELTPSAAITSGAWTGAASGRGHLDSPSPTRPGRLHAFDELGSRLLREPNQEGVELDPTDHEDGRRRRRQRDRGSGGTLEIEAREVVGGNLAERRGGGGDNRPERPAW